MNTEENTSTPADRQELSKARLVLGLQPVREALRAHGHGVERVWVSEGDSPRLRALTEYANARGAAEVCRVARRRLDALSQGVAHQGAAAWAPRLGFESWASQRRLPNLLCLALDKLQDPQNFGAVVRCAVGIGQGAVVLWGEHASAPLTPAMFRASAGGVEHARLCRVPSLAGALQEASAEGTQVVALAARADRLLQEVDLTRPTIIVVGSEGAGLSNAVKRASGVSAAVVRPGAIDSLNASVAAAIALYEANRQRSQPGVGGAAKATAAPAGQ